ncbi:LOW QUALITY PROTEIN: putative diacylglycerol O-acyltransferase MT0231 [Oculina patagonica]
MNADCISTSPAAAEAAFAVCGDFSSISHAPFEGLEETPAEIQKDFIAFIPPLHKRYKGVNLLMAITIAAIIYQLECVVTCLVFCLVIPFLLFGLAILKLGKFFVEHYIAFTRKCIPFREDDSVWQQDRATNRHIIHALMVIEGSPDIEKLRKIICERLVYGKDEKGERICPRLTQVIQKHLGHFVWKEDDEFSVEKQVLNWKGNFPKRLEDLDEAISEICSTPLPENLSPWQFLVVPILEENCFGLLLRVHHSVADGVALTRVFVRNLYDVPPQGPEPKKFSTKQRFYMWCKAILVGPMIVLTKFFSKADQSSIHGQELCGKKVVAWSKNVDLSLVKQVKNLAGTTVNDVMVSCLAGALHDYLKRQDKSSDVAKVQDMWASVPVDIRASTKSVKLKNKFALVFLRLPIVAKNAVDRLLATKQRMDIIKTSAEPLVTATTVQLLMMLPECISRTLIDFFSRKMSCVLSNVPGPQQTLYLGGQKIAQGIFWVPQRANIGVGLSIFSYGGGIRVGVYSDECVIPHPKEVVEGFEKNFWQLVNELNINDNQE